MPKTKKSKKTVGNRTVTCGKCKATGHNARTCPPAVAAPEVKKEIKTSADIPAPPIQPGPKTRIDMRHEATEKRMSTVPRRDSPTADISGAQAAPYRCVKCNSVKILIIVKVKDHNASFKAGKDVFTGDLRCENCMNKPTPSDLILKWGAAPGEVIDSAIINA